MSFLNIALLGGMSALAIPILIHLFHKSRFQVVKWGAMHLLESVLRANQRRIRLEQLILLLVRAAIPILLALAMARPVWNGAKHLLGDSRTSTVLLVDNSYSMEAGRTGVTNFSIARDEAVRIASQLKRGSEIQVLLMGEGGGPLFDAPTYDAGRVAEALGKLPADAGVATVPPALDFAGRIFAQMHESARNLVVFTDFQRVSFELSEAAELSRTLERLKKSEMAPQITFFDVGQEVRENLAVESLDFSRFMVGVGQKIQIRANLRNFGESNYQDVRVYFKADGQEKSVTQMSLGAHQKGQLLFTHTFTSAGSHVLEVSTDADPLKADNVYLASIPARDKVPVLLVNGAPSAEPLSGETDFAEIALQPFSAGRVEMADLLATKVIAPEKLDAKALSESAVVILANINRLNDEQLKALEAYVRNGGGLMVFPGNRVDANWYNRSFFKEGKGLLPMAFGALQGDSKEGSATVALGAQRFENAALEIFNDPRNGALSDSAIRQWYKFEEGPSGAMPTSVLARLENGGPFLVEKSFGEGRVIECSTALDADWSNLPLRPTYLPLLQRLSVYLASTVYPPRNLAVGSPLVAFFPVTDAGKNARLVLPGEIAVQVPVTKKGERGVVEFGRTQRPGVYTLTSPSGEVVHFAVNASRRESELQKLTGKEIEDFARSNEVALVHNGAEYQALDQSQRFGHELWRPLLWALLALMFLELYLQRRFARSRPMTNAGTVRGGRP